MTAACHTEIAVRYFNTEGPVVPAEHYCIDPLARVDLAQILNLIARKKYFVLHAPRQTGKTSTLLALQDQLNAEGVYRCLYVNLEEGQAAKDDVNADGARELGVEGYRHATGQLRGQDDVRVVGKVWL